MTTVTTKDDRTAFSADPEYYTDSESCENIPSFILMQAYVSARRTYYSCGGHYRAWRMEQAMHALVTTLEGRGITPGYTAKDLVNVGYWSVDWTKP